MKNLILLFFITVVFNTYSQTANDSIVFVSVGDNIINIPTPNKEFIEVGIERHEAFKTLVKPTNQLLCIFLDTTDYRILTNEDPKKVTMAKYMVVVFNKNFESSNCDEYAFSMIRKYTMSMLKKDINQAIDSSNSFYNISKENLGNIKLEKAKSLGCMYDIQNAFGILTLEYVVDGLIPMNILTASNFIRIKNKLINVYVCCFYEGRDDVKWITDVSKSWAKHIIKANE